MKASTIKKLGERFCGHFIQKWEEICQDDSLQGELTPGLFDDLFKEFRRTVAAAQAQSLVEFIEGKDEEADVVIVGGKKMRYKLSSTKDFLTEVGEIKVTRRLYQADTGGVCYAPLDYKWGVVGNYAVESVREAVTLMTAYMPREEVKHTLDLIAQCNASTTALKNISDGVGARVEAHIEEIEDEVQRNVSIPKDTKVLAVSMDAATVRVRGAGRTDGAAGDPFKMAMAGTISFYGKPDKDNHPQRLKTLYHGRMPEEKGETFETLFMKKALSAVESSPGAIARVLLMDGARSLWSMADRHEVFSDFERCVDFYHVCEHLQSVSELLFGMNSAQAKAWYSKYKSALKERDDGPAAVIRSISYYFLTNKLSSARRQEVQQHRSYFTNNQDKMPYADFRRRGLPIGSGPVEAACKTLIKKRLCISGARWSITGGQNVLTPRSHAKDGTWKLFWNSYKRFARQAADAA